MSKIIQANSESTNTAILSCFTDKLNKRDLADAQSEIDESIKGLSKANLLELKAMSKPHFLVEKVLQIVCALRGFKQISWNTAKEMLTRSSFKVELMQLNPQTLKPTEVLRAQQILT